MEEKEEKEEKEETSLENNIELSNSIEHTSILEYLTNPAYYSTLNKNNKANSIKATNDNNKNKEDTRFYRKRIIALTKEMLKGAIPSVRIKEAHDDYINILVNYFKLVDKTDIIQDQYSNRGQEACATEGKDPSNCEQENGHLHRFSSDFVTQGKDPSNCDQENGHLHRFSSDFVTRGLGGRAPADELMMRKPIVNSTLKNYVVTTTTHPETRIIPIKLTVDLNSPSLKTKGIKPKKIKKVIETSQEK